MVERPDAMFRPRPFRMTWRSSRAAPMGLDIAPGPRPIHRRRRSLEFPAAHVSGSGIITTTSDSDYFSFTAAAGAVSLHVNVAQFGPTLHSKAQLFDSQGNLVTTVGHRFPLADDLDDAGRRHRITSRSKASAATEMSGQYTVSGTIVPAAPAVSVSARLSVNEGSTFTLNLSASSLRPHD